MLRDQASYCAGDATSFCDMYFFVLLLPWPSDLSGCFHPAQSYGFINHCSRDTNWDILIAFSDGISLVLEFRRFSDFEFVCPAESQSGWRHISIGLVSAPSFLIDFIFWSKILANTMICPLQRISLVKCKFTKRDHYICSEGNKMAVLWQLVVTMSSEL